MLPVQEMHGNTLQCYWHINKGPVGIYIRLLLLKKNHCLASAVVWPQVLEKSNKHNLDFC